MVQQISWIKCCSENNYWLITWLIILFWKELMCYITQDTSALCRFVQQLGSNQTACPVWSVYIHHYLWHKWNPCREVFTYITWTWRMPCILGWYMVYHKYCTILTKLYCISIIYIELNIFYLIDLYILPSFNRNLYRINWWDVQHEMCNTRFEKDCSRSSVILSELQCCSKLLEIIIHYHYVICVTSIRY